MIQTDNNKQTQDMKQLTAGRGIHRWGEARKASREEQARNGSPASRSYGRDFDLEKKG